MLGLPRSLRLNCSLTLSLERSRVGFEAIRAEQNVKKPKPLNCRTCGQHTSDFVVDEPVMTTYKSDYGHDKPNNLILFLICLFNHNAMTAMAVIASNGRIDTSRYVGRTYRVSIQRIDTYRGN